MALIRNKPIELSLDEYMKLMRANFCQSYSKNTEQVETLKSLLLDAKKEIFYMKNKETLASHLSCSNTSSETRSKLSMASKHKPEVLDTLKIKIHSNIDFVANIVKLKSLDKNFQLDESNIEAVLECMRDSLKQVGYFIFHAESSSTADSNINKRGNESVDASNSQFTMSSTSQSIFNKSKTTTTSAITVSVSFPLDSILHSMQLFVNVYEIEWFFYIRNRLNDQVIRFVDDLVTFVLEYPYMKTHSPQLICCIQILIILSTSDFLLNSVVNAIVNSFHTIVRYLCEAASTSQPSQPTANSSQFLDVKDNRENKFLINNFSNSSQKMWSNENTKKNAIIENLAINCTHLCNAVESIVRIRLLDNYTSLSNQIRTNLNKTLNMIFINLTDAYPLFAIQFSKLIQLLAV